MMKPVFVRPLTCAKCYSDEVRYECADCADYWLCSSCEARLDKDRFNDPDHVWRKYPLTL
jgi:hypothetical protein